MAVSLVVHWLHLIAVVLWVGGLGFNLMVLTPNLKQMDLTNRSRLISKVLPSFLKLVWLSICVIVATGLYRILFISNITTLSDFTNTSYGISLLSKILTVIVMIVLVAIITLRFKPKIMTHLPRHIAGEPTEKTCAICTSMLKVTRSVMTAVLLLSFGVIFLAAFLRGA